MNPRCIIAVIAALAAFAPASMAGEPNSKEQVWQLGNKVTLAALGQVSGVEAAAIDKLFKDAKALAKSIGTDLAALPAADKDRVKATAAALHYLLKVAGPPLAKQVGARHGQDHVALLDVAIKSNMLLVIYVPGDENGKAIASNLKRTGPKAGLPEKTWMGVVEKVEAGQSVEQVRAAVRKMHEDVPAFLKGAKK